MGLEDLQFLTRGSLQDLLVFAGGTFLITSTVFWGVNALFLLIDLSDGPISNFLRRYKIQEDKNTPLDTQKLLSSIRVVLFNQIVVSIPMLICFYPLFLWRGVTIEKPFPTFASTLVKLCICVLVEEAGFYYAHRLFHNPFFYKRFHKKHHEWTAPIGIIGLHAHPVEHIFANTLPAFLGVLLTGGSLKFAWLWFCIALINTSNSHSGYHFPCLPSAEAHDFHHAKFDNCFGVLGILDYLHGTDAKFRQTINAKRHITAWTMTPIKEWYSEKITN